MPGADIQKSYALCGADIAAAAARDQVEAGLAESFDAWREGDKSPGPRSSLLAPLSSFLFPLSLPPFFHSPAPRALRSRTVFSFPLSSWCSGLFAVACGRRLRGSRARVRTCMALMCWRRGRGLTCMCIHAYVVRVCVCCWRVGGVQRTQQSRPRSAPCARAAGSAS
eukprot:2673354-Rhodomonas_salina.1